MFAVTIVTLASSLARDERARTGWHAIIKWGRGRGPGPGAWAGGGGGGGGWN